MKKIGQLEERERFEICMENHVFSDEYQMKKQRLLNSVEKNQKKMYKFRSMTSVAAAAALILGISATTYAAVRGIQAIITEDEEKNEVSYEINKESDDYIPPIRITAGYLPEGYQEWESGKYSPDGEWGAKGITIINAGRIQTGKATDVSNYEEQQIGEARAVITESKGYDYPWDIYLFYEEDGYVIEVVGCDELSKEEMLKVCEGITYEQAPELDPEGTYQAFSIESMEDEDAVPYEATVSVPEEDFLDLYQTFNIEGIQYTVTDINITDTVNTELLSENTTSDYDRVKQFVQEDGTLVPFTRSVSEWNDGELQDIELDTVPVKNVELTLLLENTGEETNEDVFAGMRWIKMKDRGDGIYKITDEIPGYEKGDNFRAVNHYAIEPDGFAYYFDSSSYAGSTHFYYMSMEAGEKKEIHLWMAVPEDELDQAYVSFGTGTDEYIRIKQD